MSAEQASAREAILAAVRAARPPAVARPEAVASAGREPAATSRRDAFTAAATAAGAVVSLAPRGDAARIVAGAIDGASSVLSYSTHASSSIARPDDLRSLDTLDVIVCESSLGVAENGAVWIATSDAVLRAALFLATRVVILVEEAQLVDDLHQAYERIDVRGHSFGAFIAGPSKTADIEQSLVIGAHGPMALTLVLVQDGA